MQTSFSRRSFLASAAAAACAADRLFAETGRSDLTRISASDLAHRIANREVSCVEAMQAYLARISHVNPKINAIVQLRAEQVLVDEATDQILGAHLIGHSGEELIHLFALAMRNGISASQLAATLFAFPTFSADVKSMV